MTSSKTSSYDIIQWHQACIMLSGLQGFYNGHTAHYNGHTAHYILWKCVACCRRKCWNKKERSWGRSQNDSFLHLLSKHQSGAQIWIWMKLQQLFFCLLCKDTSPINRGRLWRLKARVWYTKSFITLSLKLKKSFSQSISQKQASSSLTMFCVL